MKSVQASNFRRSKAGGSLLLLLLTGLQLGAQEPSVPLKPTRDHTGDAAAIAGSKEDPAAVERGGKVYATYCQGCHGAGAKGGPGAPDLVRSLLVLDDEKGILIAPVVREGRPDKGMPKLGLTEPQIADVVAWLHVRTYAAGHRTTYAYGDVLTGDPKKGEAFFNSAQGRCSTCHSVKGDLAGVGKKYDAFSLQGRWLQPRNQGRNNPGTANSGSPRVGPTDRSVTVTLADGKTVSGGLDRIDDFTVSLRDSQGAYHSFSREVPGVKVDVHDPLQAHTDLLRVYTDADIHNVTAYLHSLQ
jgi:cytochrome c oxidase cbb3-type subunit III